MGTKNYIVLVVSLCMIVGHVRGGRIRIANELKLKKNLEMSCYSGDNKIAPRVLRPGTHWDFGFGTNVFGGTKFTCKLRQGPNFRHNKEFIAFKQVSASDRGGIWDWRAREDGIYLKVWGRKHAKGEVNMHKKYDWIY